jgi:hypothetical protein
MQCAAPSWLQHPSDRGSIEQPLKGSPNENRSYRRKRANRLQACDKLREHGHQAVPASPDSGVNTLTGERLAETIEGAAVVVDLSNFPSFEDAAVLNFFKTSTRNVLDAEAAAGVGHHVALSVVGTERLSESGYVRAQMAPERESHKRRVRHRGNFSLALARRGSAAPRGGPELASR